MKFKNTYEFETLFVRCLVFAVACVLCLVSLSSCTSSKNVSKETIVKKETIDSIVTEKKDSVKVSIDEKLKTNDNTVEFFHPYDWMTEGDTICDTVFMPKIIYRPDGSFEATGVKKVNLKSTEWQKKYDSLNNEYNLEINRRMSLEEQLKGKVVNKEKRPVAVAWLLFLTIGFITGFYSKHKLK